MPQFPYIYQDTDFLQGSIEPVPLEFNIEGLYDETDRRRRRNPKDKNVSSQVHSVGSDTFICNILREYLGYVLCCDGFEHHCVLNRSGETWLGVTFNRSKVVRDEARATAFLQLGFNLSDGLLVESSLDPS